MIKKIDKNGDKNQEGERIKVIRKSLEQQGLPVISPGTTEPTSRLSAFAVMLYIHLTFLQRLTNIP